jgi:rare lipoprotein A
MTTANLRTLIITSMIIGAPDAPAAGIPDSGTAPPRLASWYGEEYRGKTMANGQKFDPEKRTCASWFYPMGTKLEVSYGSKKTIVTVTDRGPARGLVAKGRVIDLSERAFKDLAPPSRGLLPVNIKKR